MSPRINLGMGSARANNTKPKKLLTSGFMWIRRAHLYLGLFLFPWAILYGFTGFLFNHPASFSQHNSIPFGSDYLLPEGLSVQMDPEIIAGMVVEKLNERNDPGGLFSLAGPPMISGKEMMTAQVRKGKDNLLISVDLKSGNGTIRHSKPVRTEEKSLSARAPFAVGTNPTGQRNGGGPQGTMSRGESNDRTEGLKLDQGIPEKGRKIVSAILQRNGFQAEGEIKLLSAPSIIFPMRVADEIWKVTYHGVNGAVSGEKENTTTLTVIEPLEWRNFLTRLHKLHGYPEDNGSRLIWAILVDGMAFTMLFWGFSGIFMWWQLKALRFPGAVTLILSFICSVSIGFLMHGSLAMGGR